MKKIIGLTVLVVLLSAAPGLLAEETVVKVFPKKTAGAVNKKILGNNLIAYDPSTYEGWGNDYYGYSDYGAGMWDAERHKPEREVVALAKEAGVSMFRFPGGCGTHLYDWKKAIGAKRSHFLFGLDEFLSVCDESGAEPVLTVSFFTGNEQDAADLVAYLNLPAERADNRWPQARAENGHPAAYQVKYFEIGNEVWHGNHNDVKAVSPDEYAKRYLSYYDAMKKTDPAVQIGAVLCPDLPGWDAGVLENIKEKIDFAIVHTYPAPTVDMLELIFMRQHDIFSTSLAVPVLKDEPYFEAVSRLLREKCGREVPLAITEYNGGFNQDKPVPYRHSLGTALINAELVKVFMKPSNNILMAHYWQFNNSYWGMIANGFDGSRETLDKPYYKRPNFYVYELYKKYFGSVLIETVAQGKTYTIKKHSTTPVPYLSVNASTNEDGSTVYLMVLNKHMEKNMQARLEFEDFIPEEGVKLFVLNGPEVAATNEVNKSSVGIKEKEAKSAGQACEITFEPHSLTAIVIERKKE